MDEYSDMAHFGNFIRDLRIARGLSQSELARLCNLGPATVNRLELYETAEIRRSTAVDLLRGLHSASPLSAAEADQFAELTGISALVRTVQRMIDENPVIQAGREAAREFIAPGGSYTGQSSMWNRPALLAPTGPADRPTDEAHYQRVLAEARARFDALIAELGVYGVLRVLDSIETLRRAAGPQTVVPGTPGTPTPPVPVPPIRARPEPGTLIHRQETLEEDRAVTVLSPHGDGRGADQPARNTGPRSTGNTNISKRKRVS